MAAIMTHRNTRGQPVEMRMRVRAKEDLDHARARMLQKPLAYEYLDMGLTFSMGMFVECLLIPSPTRTDCKITEARRASYM